MLYTIFNMKYSENIALFSIIAAFILVMVVIKKTQELLPHDLGREFAMNGQLSKGKPRGAGIIFVICFVIMSLIFVPFSVEYLIYCILLVAAMLSGFLDDRSDKPWGEYKKGIIDLVIALVAALTFLNFNPGSAGIQFHDYFLEIPKILYVVLAIILIWASINVTNCSDGVDGLSGSLSIITFMTAYMIFMKQESVYAHIVLLMVACILAYLWFNISPSKILMGDAGSRALGFLIAVVMMKTFNPLFFLLAAFMLIVDGGLGLVKVALLRFCKIHILKEVRTPIHDYARKTLEWSDSQVVFRFTMIQLLASVVLFLMM